MKTRKTKASKPSTFRTVLNELANSFVSDVRADKTAFYKFGGKAPAWARESGRKVHSALYDIGPNDWVYENMCWIAQAFTNYEGESASDYQDNGYLTEIAEAQADVYNRDLLNWLSSNLLWANMVDQAVENLGHSKHGIIGDIAYGQIEALRIIAETLMDAIQTEVDSRKVMGRYLYPESTK